MTKDKLKELLLFVYLKDIDFTDFVNSESCACCPCNTRDRCIIPDDEDCIMSEKQSFELWWHNSMEDKSVLDEHKKALIKELNEVLEKERKIN